MLNDTLTVRGMKYKYITKNETFLTDFVIIVKNDAFQECFKKYVSATKLPSKTQLQTHLPQVKFHIKSTIQSELINITLWITVDEMNDKICSECCCVYFKT